MFRAFTEISAIFLDVFGDGQKFLEIYQKRSKNQGNQSENCLKSSIFNSPEASAKLLIWANDRIFTTVG